MLLQEGPEGLVLEEDAGTFWMRFVFLAWRTKWQGSPGNAMAGCRKGGR